MFCSIDKVKKNVLLLIIVFCFTINFLIHTAHSCTMNLTDKINSQTKPPYLI